MIAAETLIIPSLQAFFWFDDALQAALQAKGWGHVTRPQSMVMANVALGVRRPSAIAKTLGVSRQAVHATIAQMVAKGMLELEEDVEDRRNKVVVPSPVGRAMGVDALDAMALIVAELRRRIGSTRVDRLVEIFGADWGEAPTILPSAPQETLPGEPVASADAKFG